MITAEVSFCGHATIATGVVLGDTHSDGTYLLSTSIGEVPVTVRVRDGQREAALTSVEPEQSPVTVDVLGSVLDLLGWQRSDLDPKIPPIRAYAGAWHLVLAAAHQDRLAAARAACGSRFRPAAASWSPAPRSPPAIHLPGYKHRNSPHPALSHLFDAGSTEGCSAPSTKPAGSLGPTPEPGSSSDRPRSWRGATKAADRRER